MYDIEVEKDVRIFVNDLNPGSKKTILFIHGWPVNHKMFEYQFTQLPRYGFRCIGIDLRGFGNSDQPWKGYSYNRLADDIRIVIETLKLENVTLVGFSMGGAIAIRYMARHSGYGISKLVLLAAAAPVFTQRKDYPFGFTKKEVNMLIKKTYTDRPNMLKEFGSIFFASKVSKEFMNWFHGLGLEASNHATAMCAISLRDEDLRRDLRKVQVPTGIFHGLLDQICPYDFAVFMHEGIKRSKLLPFEYSGHGIFYDELDKFNHFFLQFLDR